jgi:hypothetical protein
MLSKVSTLFEKNCNIQTRMQWCLKEGLIKSQFFVDFFVPRQSNAGGCDAIKLLL